MIDIETEYGDKYEVVQAHEGPAIRCRYGRIYATGTTDRTRASGTTPDKFCLTMVNSHKPDVQEVRQRLGSVARWLNPDQITAQFEQSQFLAVAEIMKAKEKVDPCKTI